MLTKKRFKIISYTILIIGIILWGVVLLGLNQKEYLKVGGSSDMILRIMAINEAIKNGEKTYSFETDKGPGGVPMERNNK